MKGNEELQGSQIYVNTANTWFTDFSDIPGQASPVQSSPEYALEETESTISELSFPLQVANKWRIFLLVCRMIDHVLDIVTLLCWRTQGKFMFRLTQSSHSQSSPKGR